MRPALICWLSAALAITGFAIHVCFLNPDSDLAIMYASGQEWNTTGQPYAAKTWLPNLNPPTVVLLLLGPIARLPWEVARVVWMVAGALSIVGVAVWTSRAIPLSWDRAVVGWSVALGTVAAQSIWSLGQISWWLLPLAAASWWAYRSRNEMWAGVWLGALIATKPFFALMALPLGWRTCVAAAGTSLAITLGAMLVTGLGPWIAYQEVTRSVSWMGDPVNASPWGIAARLFPDRTWLELPWPALVLLATMGITLLWGSRVPDRDARWALAGLATIMASPAGWVHYVTLMAPAVIALWAKGLWSRGCALAVLIWWVPYSITRLWSSYFVLALAVLWLALWHVSRPSAEREAVKRGSSVPTPAHTNRAMTNPSDAPVR